MTEKLLSQPGMSEKWKKLFLLARKTKKLLFKNWPKRFNNGFLKKNSEQKNSTPPRQERVLQLLFLLVETIIEIRKNQILKK